MAIVAFWRQKVVTYEVLELVASWTSYRFLQFLRDTLWPAIQRKRIARPVILMDNARPHNAVTIGEFLEQRHWERLPQDPYSPDENPADIQGFKLLKKPIRGRRYSNYQ